MALSGLHSSKDTYIKDATYLFIDELHYTEVKERSHMDAGDDGTCGFLLSTFSLIPLQLNAFATRSLSLPAFM